MNATPEAVKSNLPETLPELKIHYLADFVAYIDRGPKTTRTYLSDLRQFAAWMDYNGIKAPTREDIILYRQYLTGEHAAIRWTENGAREQTDENGRPVMIRCRPTTTAQYLKTVKRFFEWTEAAGIYPNISKGIHAPKIRQDAHRREALTAPEVLAVEKSISARAAARTAEARQARKDTAGRMERATEQGARLRAMYILAVNAGLRTVEISRANIKDLEERNGRAWIYIYGKGHTEPDQKKALADEVAQAIKEYLQIRKSCRPEEPLFVSTGNRSGGRRIAPTTISAMLKRAMIEAGISSERITAHSLRHTTGTEVQRMTGDLYQTQKYLRHSNPATTEIYLHNATEDAEAKIAQDLYNSYHQTGTGDRDNLERIIKRLNPEQISALADLAAKLNG